MDQNEGQGNLSATVEVASNKTVDSFPVLEPLQHGSKTIGLVVQRKHYFMKHHQS
jgi:hypothetical protein